MPLADFGHRGQHRLGPGPIGGADVVSLEGPVQVSDDPVRVARAVADYTRRYRPPWENPTRVAPEITVERILGRA